MKIRILKKGYVFSQNIFKMQSNVSGLAQTVESVVVESKVIMAITNVQFT